MAETKYKHFTMHSLMTSRDSKIKSILSTSQKRAIITYKTIKSIKVFTYDIDNN